MNKLLVLLIGLSCVLLTGCLTTPSTTSKAGGNPLPSLDQISYQDYQSVGNTGATVTFIEFSDYQCPFCKKFTSETLHTLLETYVASGFVKFVFMDFPLEFHPEGVPAAIAAHCAGEQGQYYPYHDRLFEHSQELGPELYSRLAQELNLDTELFAGCLGREDVHQRVKDSVKTAQSFGINGTPSFVINDTVVKGARSRNNFQEIIDGHLNGKVTKSKTSPAGNESIACSGNDDCNAPRTFGPYCSRTDTKEVCLTKSVPTCQNPGTPQSECVTMITESCSTCPFETTCESGVCRDDI